MGRKLEEFNREFGRQILWLPWQRPGFELALMIETSVRDNPEADGLILGSHGLFTWGPTPRECYLASIRTIDQMGEFIAAHRSRGRPPFGGLAGKPIEGRQEMAARILPALRGAVSSNRRVIAHFTDSQEALVCRREVVKAAQQARDELPGSLSTTHSHFVEWIPQR